MSIFIQLITPTKILANGKGVVSVDRLCLRSVAVDGRTPFSKVRGCERMATGGSGRVRSLLPRDEVAGAVELVLVALILGGVDAVGLGQALRALGVGLGVQDPDEVRLEGARPVLVETRFHPHVDDGVHVGARDVVPGIFLDEGESRDPRTHDLVLVVDDLEPLRGLLLDVAGPGREAQAHQRVAAGGVVAAEGLGEILLDRILLHVGAVVLVGGASAFGTGDQGAQGRQKQKHAHGVLQTFGLNDQ